MFLSEVFKAIKRLAASINRSADLWDEANHQLEERLRIDKEDTLDLPALPNGRKLVRK